jgi:hypothetical protein
MATESDKINTAALGTLVVVGALATLSIALGVDALVRFEVTQLQEERAGMASQAFHAIAAEQNGKLAGNPTWVDKTKGVVSVPIDKAIGGVLSDLARDPSSATEPGPPDAGAAAHDAFGATDAAAAGSATTAPSGTPASSAAPVPAGSVTLPQTPTSATPAVPKGSGAPATPKAPKGPTPIPAAPAPTSTQ